MEPRGAALQDAQAFIASLDEVDLSRFRAVGTYARYDEAVRNALQDARQKILAGFEPPGHKRENHLIWAAPGTGKTYFVQQVAATLPTGVRYHEINLAKCMEPEFRAALGRLDGGQASLCLIDEVDAKPQEPWPYEVLLPYLDAAVERGARFVFVLAGSSGASLDEIKQRIAARPKGTDLLSRIPTGHEHVIGPMSLGDRLLIVLSQLRQCGAEAGRDIRAIEKLGLYYVALTPRLANARQLREFAVRAVERVPKTDHRVKYDHLFVPGDPENKAFWMQAQPIAERLVNSFVVVTGDAATTTLASVSIRIPTSSDGAAAAIPAVAAGPSTRTNLPRELTSFIGRKQEIEEVKRLLSTTALLTLHGPGGCGKTRLALRVASDLTEQYADGVWVAELAALSDPGLVPKVVATALDIPEQPGRSLTDTLKDFLRQKSILLVLDNCEHMVGACAELASSLLRACPTLQILATSREPLRISGETVWTVLPLSVPEPSRVSPSEDLMRFDGIRLFVDRAAASKPDFEFVPVNAAAVAQVCSRLDGIPLAIELAAARVRVLTVAQIAARLDDCFKLLTGGDRTALSRHQTLRATMDWSYGLLSDREKILLRRLSVFAGGWTVEAAEAICTGDGIDDTDVLDVLTSLADKSLIIVETPGRDARYRMLETVRQYGGELLQNAGERSEMCRRHRDWYLSLAEQAAPELHGLQQAAWMSRLETERDNLRVAFEWTMTNADAEREGLRFASTLADFWRINGDWNEGYEWLEEVLTRHTDVPRLIRANTLAQASSFAWRLGKDQEALAIAEEGLSLLRELGDNQNSVQCLVAVANVAMQRGDYLQAKKAASDGLRFATPLQNKYYASLMLSHLGEATRYEENYDQAIAIHKECLSLAEEAGDAMWIANILRHLGIDHLRRGDLIEATEFYKRSLSMCKHIRTKWVPVETLNGLGDVACEERQYGRAARLFGAASQLREMLGLRAMPSDQAVHDQYISSARSALGMSTFSDDWAEGRAMTLEQAAEYALAEG